MGANPSLGNPNMPTGQRMGAATMKMLKGKNLLFRQQFVVGPHYPDSFKSWKKHEITQELVLSSHPDLNICHLYKNI